jgi:hypothetical protein
MRHIRYLPAAAAVAFAATAAIAFAGQHQAPAPRGHIQPDAARASARSHDAGRAGRSSDTEGSAVDTDNVQQGDQTTPDTPSVSPASAAGTGSEQSGSETEQDTDTEQGAPGEPAGGGHQDPPGQDVNHSCTGNCQE